MLRFVRFSAINTALCYGAASILVLAMFAGPLWYAWSNTIADGRTETLVDDSNRLTTLFNQHGPAQLATAIGTQVGGQPLGIGRIIVLADPQRNILAGNLPLWPPMPAPAPDRNGVRVVTLHMNGGHFRVALLSRELPGGYRLLVGNNVDRFERLETLALYGLIGCAATFVLLAVVGGLVVRYAMLARVRAIHQTSAAIVEGDLSRRLPSLDHEDELELLTQTVNRMLEQIEQLVHGVRNVSNAIAHDLRTPLAELRARLEELTVARPGPEATFAEVDAAIADVDRVLAIFNALLRLAEIDSGARRAGFVSMEVAQVVSDVAEFYQPLAELNDVVLHVDTSGNLSAYGDPLLLAQAVSNLIENALKYAPDSSRIDIAARERIDQQIEIVVADHGPGISDAEKPRVTERFYRSDVSRASPGVGLGLSLVAAVARLHHGALELGDSVPHGLRATLLLSSAQHTGHAKKATPALAA
jgi:signal transduction histidine kinase